MSKKTRKQKILVDLKRKKTFINQANMPVAQKNLPLPSNQNTSIYLYPVQLIKKDLTKTLILCILAISFEIALFFLIEKKISLPF